MSDIFTFLSTAFPPTAQVTAFVGREACVRDLFRPLYAQFTETQIQDVLSITAEGDLVIVESKSRPMTLANGRTYSNAYCYICRFAGDRLVSVREYLDTAAMDAALDPPPWAAEGRAGVQLPDAAAGA